MNAGPLLPKDIASAEGVERMMPVGGSDNPREAGAFQKLLQEQAGEGKKIAPMATSPFALAGGPGTPQLAAGPTLQTIQGQVLHAQTTVGDINNMLQTPKLKLKSSTKYLLGNKLGQANQELRTVNSKMGGDQANEEHELPAASGPLAKYLSYVLGSQVALQNTQQQLQSLSEKGTSLNPAELLFLQIKLGKAQQLLDYSALLLAKGVEDMKQLFSVQI